MLRIEILKPSAEQGLLRCTRADGSVTWQKQGRHAGHFALHDLTHYSVETVLGYRQGFFGLVAAGWDIEDTTGKGARGALPPEAVEVERIVGLFDSERAGGQRWAVADFNAVAPRPLRAEAIEAIRQRRSQLFAQWRAVAPGDCLELAFDGRGPQRGCAARPASARTGMGSPEPHAGAALAAGERQPVSASPGGPGSRSARSRPAPPR